MTSYRACLVLVGLLLAAGSARAESCRAEVGASKAHRLVEQCLDVSQASHPPCNDDNACSLIVDEIRRGCQGLGDDAPPYCDQY